MTPNHLAVLVVFASCLASSARACDAPVLLSPAAESSVQSPRPTIVWTAVPGATEYDIEVVSRIPEGEVIVRQQVSTAALAFSPSQALAHDRSVVTIALSARCGGARSTVVERRFKVEAGDTCPAPSQVSLSRQGTSAHLAWRKAANVEAIEARFFVGADARPGELHTSPHSPLLAALPASSPWVFGLRSKCAMGVSEWTWLREQDMAATGPAS